LKSLLEEQKPEIPLWWEIDGDTKAYAINQGGGQTAVFTWEEWEEGMREASFVAFYPPS
jgi:hypothetical protein